MTALTQYERLESGGLWRPDPDAQRREVVVAFGDATLVVTDTAGRPLAHWSLAAVERVNPGEAPALFAPDPEATETLEIDDALMVEAIEKVRRAVARSRPQPRRLRMALAGLSLAGLAALAVFWLPGALRDQAASVVPLSKRVEIGATLLGHLQRLTGPACRADQGRAALARLHGRLLGPQAQGQVVVLPLGRATALALPGGLTVLDQSLVQQVDDPAIPAGYILAAEAWRRDHDPVSDILAQAPLSVTARLLTTSDMPRDTLRAHAAWLNDAPAPDLAATTLRPLFDQARLNPAPFAHHRAALGAPLPDLMGTPDAPAGPPVLSDSDWVALQGICDL